MINFQLECYLHFCRSTCKTLSTFLVGEHHRHRRPPALMHRLNFYARSHFSEDKRATRAREDRRNKEANGCRSKLLHCNNFRISAMQNGGEDYVSRPFFFSEHYALQKSPG